MKLTQNQFFGEEFEKSNKLPEGSSFFDITNNILYFYNGNLAPVELKLNWGQLSGDLNNQQDLIDFINSNRGGLDGESAYEIAVDNGFVGTEAEWLTSLQGADGTNGVDGINGTNGLDGTDGEDGDSAYQIALNNGFVGTEQEWLDSLQGQDGTSGIDGTNGTNGVDGTDGDSAYQVWINEGNSGTEQDFLDSLQGAQATLQVTSTQSSSDFNLVSSHVGGINKVEGSTDITVTVQPNATEDIEVGSVIVFKQYDSGSLTAVPGTGVTLTSKQTYKPGDTLTLWQESTDNWVIINPPKKDLVVGLTQAEYDALTPDSDVAYYITDTQKIYFGTILMNSGGGGTTTYDTDAQAYIDAGSIVDTNYSDAINDLVLDLKSNSLWTKFNTIHLLNGGSADIDKYNLKNPLDTDAAHRITFRAGLTHASTGVTGTTASGENANPHLVLADFSQDNNSIWFYQSDDRTTSAQIVDMGASYVGSPGLYLTSSYSSTDDTMYCMNFTGTDQFVSAPANNSGLWGNSRISSSQYKIYQNGTVFQTFNNSSAAPTVGHAINFMGNSSGFQSSSTYRIFLTGEGLTDAEAVTLNTIITDFLTAVDS